MSKFSFKEWVPDMQQAYSKMLQDPNVVGEKPDKEHLAQTPERVTRTLLNELFVGVKQDPSKILSRAFSEEEYDQMITVSDMEFVSFCMHHILPFVGRVHFGYIPDGRIVGLSKIPRLVKALSRRLQVQERLSEEIVDTFMECIRPQGCGVVIEALHMCMLVRGIEQKCAITRTTSLRGSFKVAGVKAEFLQSVLNGKPFQPL